MSITDRRDGISEGFAAKKPCRVHTTANITLNGQQTINGVAVVSGNRVLVKNQTNGVQNGIYVVSTGDWVRAKDFDGRNDIVNGTLVFVVGGTTTPQSIWFVSTADNITIDTTSITFDLYQVITVSSAGGDLTGTYPNPTIGTNKVTNAQRAQMPAYTIKGNATGSTANEADLSIPALTPKSFPVAADKIMIADSAASDALKYTTVSALAPALVNYSQPQGRLTLTSGTAIPSASVAGATTVYYTPAAGDSVPIYDGTNMVPTTFTQLSQVTTDTTKSPAAVGASLVYDIFVWSDSGTLRATRGPAWTNDTTRSAGTALVVVKGIYLNNASITNGPAASRGTYVGTIRSNASSTIDFIFGTATAGGGAAFLYVWNLYNQVYFQTEVNDTSAAWTYSSATVRAANASTANRISFVSGLAVNGFNAAYQDTLSVPNVVNASAYFGVSLDATAALQKFCRVVNNTTAGALALANTAVGIFPAQLGVHFVQAVEAGDGTNTSTWQPQINGQSLTAGLWQ